MLDSGIRPEFYESEYDQYFQEVMFDTPELLDFHPDLIYIHTSARNLHMFPTVRDSEATIETLLEQAYRPFEQIWKRLQMFIIAPSSRITLNLPFIVCWEIKMSSISTAE